CHDQCRCYSLLLVAVFWSVLASSLYLFSVRAPPTTAIYTLSLHDALPIWLSAAVQVLRERESLQQRPQAGDLGAGVGNKRLERCQLVLGHGDRGRGAGERSGGAVGLCLSGVHVAGGPRR